MWIPLLLLLVLIGLAVAGCKVTRSGYESAPYQVVRADRKFQVRDYPALPVVETPMANANGSDGSFGRLFGFITGKNEAKQKIAMTTPVFMSGSETNATMAFVLPAQRKSGAVPQPSDGAVTVRELAAGRFAVLRYSGGRNAKQEAESLARLKAWMATDRLSVLSPPVYGYFDPPWTPAFLLHGFHFLRGEGVMAIILPHGVLFRGGAEERIRTKLLKDGHIDTVIGLPANLFYSTGIPVCILVLKKCKKPDDMLFINAAERVDSFAPQAQSGCAQRFALSVSLSPLAEFGST